MRGSDRCASTAGGNRGDVVGSGAARGLGRHGRGRVAERRRVLGNVSFGNDDVVTEGSRVLRRCCRGVADRGDVALPESPSRASGRRCGRRNRGRVGALRSGCQDEQESDGQHDREVKFPGGFHFRRRCRLDSRTKCEELMCPVPFILALLLGRQRAHRNSKKKKE